MEFSSDANPSDTACSEDWTSRTVQLLQHSLSIVPGVEQAPVIGIGLNDSFQTDGILTMLPLVAVSMLCLFSIIVHATQKHKSKDPGPAAAAVLETQNREGISRNRQVLSLAGRSEVEAKSQEDSDAAAGPVLEVVKDEGGMSAQNFLLGIIGSSLESYEFGLFGLFVAEIGNSFFPQGTDNNSILWAFATFGSAFIMRPVGAAIFGYIGDRYGRVIALKIAIVLMACSTCLIGLLPPEVQIGIAAPIIIVLARLTQGLSVGGQIGGSYVYLLESARLEQRSTIAACFSCALLAGLSVCSIVAAGLHGFSGDSWYWRIPFVVAGFVALLTGWASWDAEETAEYLTAQATGQLHQSPVLEAIRRNFYEMLQLFFVTGFIGTAIYSLHVWLPTFESELRPNSMLSSAYAINAAALGVLCILMLSWGFNVDSENYKVLYVTGAVSFIILVPFIFPFFGNSNAEVVFAAYVILDIPLSVVLAVHYQFAFELLTDASVRYTAAALTHGLGMAIFSGPTPIIATLLAGSSRNLIGVGLFVFAASVPGVSTLTWLALRKVEDY